MRLITYLRLTNHIVIALLILFLVAPLVSDKRRGMLIKSWSKKLLRILRIQLSIHGVEVMSQQGCLIVANHISWVDIHAINACMPVQFVAKSEVASWPVFGQLARRLNTIFINRNSYRSIQVVNEYIQTALKKEDYVCIFPEGTSTNGQTVLDFRANLFQAAIDARAPCFPLAIEYTDLKTNLRSTTPAFIGEMGLIESIVRIVNSPPLIVKLHFCEPCENVGDRKILASQSRAKIKTILDLH